jgi:hypothetical protein
MDAVDIEPPVAGAVPRGEKPLGARDRRLVRLSLDVECRLADLVLVTRGVADRLQEAHTIESHRRHPLRSFFKPREQPFVGGIVAPDQGAIKAFRQTGRDVAMPPCRGSGSIGPINNLIAYLRTLPR